MIRLTPKFGPMAFGIIQSGMTSGVASGIAGLPQLADGNFVLPWAKAWLLSWLLVAPLVIVAAPFVQRLVQHLTGCPRDTSS